ncbi:MAG: glycoside hydrolase [Bacteroidetes bacterium]|nr:MAG: glycoside hydrolase [Bacteroidota bacterium]
MEGLKKKAIEILKNNWQGSFTIPCAGLYPFQWKWDSGFIAIGLAHFDMAKAKKEISTLLDAQWGNGFIPHIIFHNESDTYFPGPDYHSTYLHPQASKKYKSTGMTQPPVTGFVLQELYRIEKDKEDTLLFIEKVIDKVYENHNYFYQNRDPFHEGLVYIYHNWESGTDNSPMWDDIFETMNSPEYSFKRRDTAHVNPEQRPSKREYDHYLHILEIAKEHHYDDKKIAESSPFLVQDPLFNSMLIKSNQSLIELYALIGNNHEKIGQLKEWQKKSIRAFNEKLYDKELGAYIHYDLRNDKSIKHISSSSFAPLFAGIPSQERAQRVIDTLEEKFGGKDNYLCASFDTTSDKYNPVKYWRGPVWINLNWILYYGLKKYGFQDLALQIKNDSIELVEKVGFYEYFDPRKEIYRSGDCKGYGGRNFSWTAALILDLLNKK